MELLRKPRGRIPKDTKAWLEVWPEMPWEIAVCTCGHWYHRMDHLAPYHTELNYCKHCDITKPSGKA